MFRNRKSNALCRKEGIIPYLRSDGKVQVTVEYINDFPLRIDTILVSTQHQEDIAIEELENDIIEKVIKPTVDEDMIDYQTKFLINPTGKFIIGGAVADTGLTGRKIIVDTYGGYAHHGGGAFSGKDATKVDRSVAYMLRYEQMAQKAKEKSQQYMNSNANRILAITPRTTNISRTSFRKET